MRFERGINPMAKLNIGKDQPLINRLVQRCGNDFTVSYYKEQRIIRIQCLLDGILPRWIKKYVVEKIREDEGDLIRQVYLTADEVILIVLS